MAARMSAIPESVILEERKQQKVESDLHNLIVSFQQCLQSSEIIEADEIILKITDTIEQNEDVISQQTQHQILTLVI